ncbi:hypothetical protein LS71_001835 [Helicobacter jaachi]|uniref:Periplasmic protein n=1 Tax=Helicobacter jaachi TaxID=1677920 RepID=A0A4U8TC49_9HELI|nr:hypothetical protein [Helicobacter jaachi]TLD97511.1 hypothetical protein LS71_001835 [Helicobacter jaachi]
MRYIKVALCALCVNIALAGEWVMFSDGKDTYIYSSNTGEIYIRHSMGKKNYEDVFVKMPRGQQPTEIKGKSAANIPQPQLPDSQAFKDMQLNALKKSQEMLNTAIE